MTISTKFLKGLLSIVLSFITYSNCFSQHVAIGSGGYSTSFPGTDAAGRNSYPSGTPYTIGTAASKPAPTNDWWSAKIKNAHADNLFNYPFTMKTKNSGLVTTYIPWGVIDNIEPVIVGVTGLNASAAKVSNFSDWTVTLDWQNSNHHFSATTGIGMPFIYFEKDSTDIAQIEVNQGTATISSELLVINNLRNGADFVIYAPSGSTWIKNGNTYTSSLNGKNYWSLAFIPLNSTNTTATANLYKKYAYVFPTNTTTTWNYNQSNGEVTTNFNVATDVKEGTDTNMLIGLLPHQWNNLSSTSAQPTGLSYSTIRGELKTLAGNSFQVSNTFYGILPTLPYLDHYSNNFNPGDMQNKVDGIKNDALDTWTDSYNEGQVMNRLIQTARIADLMGDTASVNTIVHTVKDRLEDWLKSEPGEIAFLFYYNTTWSSLIGYPAGHGQDGNLNDHHFHWGYFIHAAAFLEQFQPGWASNWGPMVNLLVRDAASSDRNDPSYPFLRNFSPYAGHCWANGFASFPQGNDQESTSESMQFNSSLIHWGSITGNTAIRDLGIYLYTTEQSAIEEYWFDVYNRNFQSSQQYSLVSRVWGNSYDNGTFWTSDIAASYGIEMYPIHGGSLYLGHDTTYVNQLWNEIETNTGILSNQVNPNLWHDVYWQYLSFINPSKAIQLYDSYPNRNLKFGVSDAQTYHWLHAMNVLGNVDATITSDHPIAAVFKKGNNKTYTAHNYSNNPITVTFSDSYTLQVPANSMATSRDINVEGLLTSDFNEVYPNGSLPLKLSINAGTPTKVEFLQDGILIGQDTAAPFEFTATNLTSGKHRFYARIYVGNEFKLSNILTIFAGDQIPFSGTPIIIPGTIEAGNYDVFEGGSGDGISYQDNDRNNNGDYRTNEAVDATNDPVEGKIVGWINKGEWLEYTIDVQTPGFYNVSIRYASGNTAGGGPFHLILGTDTLRSFNNLTHTGGWNTWNTRSLNFVPLKSGVQTIRIAFGGGEFNLGRLNFNLTSTFPYSQPIANAGSNQLIQLPNTSTTLNGSLSVDPYAGNLNYRWAQVYGPSVLGFNNNTLAQPTITGLIEGVYKIKLIVDNGSYFDDDEVYIISSNSNNVAPKVSIIEPFEGSRFIEYDTIQIAAIASDLNDTVASVSFYANNQLIGTDNQPPYLINWIPAWGNYSLTVIANDQLGASSSSGAVNIIVQEAPSCLDTSSNGEFMYEFSPANNNPTLTFIPLIAGSGSPTCILYYGTSTSGPLPGYNVTPNVPFRINASQGSTVYFYYTYSYPGAGQHDNSANKDSYKIGTCRIATGISKQDISIPEISFYPNPVSDVLTINLPNSGNQNSILIYDSKRILIDKIQTSELTVEYSMHNLSSGIYFFNWTNNEQTKTFKVIKK